MVGMGVANVRGVKAKHHATITLGKDSFSMMNPPTAHEFLVDKGGRKWKIGGSNYGIVLRDSGECHPEFVSGMSMLAFVQWINDQQS